MALFPTNLGFPLVRQIRTSSFFSLSERKVSVSNKSQNFAGSDIKDKLNSLSRKTGYPDIISLSSFDVPY